jgi:hypothetical protein
MTMMTNNMPTAIRRPRPRPDRTQREPEEGRHGGGGIEDGKKEKKKMFCFLFSHFSRLLIMFRITSMQQLYADQVIDAAGPPKKLTVSLFLFLFSFLSLSTNYRRTEKKAAFAAFCSLHCCTTQVRGSLRHHHHPRDRDQDQDQDQDQS